jgi:hypothetical protein
MTRAKVWLDWDGSELCPKEGHKMPEIDGVCDGDLGECENKPEILIRPYYLAWKSESLCTECYERRLQGP